MKLKISNVQYHRNGVSGMPFYAVNFDDKDIGNMIGIVFPKYDPDKERYTGGFNPRVAIFQTELLGQGNINFGENSYRGDCYADDLIKAINKDEKKIMNTYAKTVEESANKLIRELKNEKFYKENK